MKSFHFTVWAILILFLAVMGRTTFLSFSRKSNICKIDAAQIEAIREQKI
jgi:hypothetical protein